MFNKEAEHEPLKEEIFTELFPSASVDSCLDSIHWTSKSVEPCFTWTSWESFPISVSDFQEIWSRCVGQLLMGLESKFWPRLPTTVRILDIFGVFLFFLWTGVIKRDTHLGGILTIQKYAKFEGFPENDNALFELVQDGSLPVLIGL